MTLMDILGFISDIGLICFGIVLCVSISELIVETFIDLREKINDKGDRHGR